MTTQDEQKRPDPPTRPAWVREPRVVPKTESRPAPAPDESHAPDEPGYGHGV